MKQLIFTLLTTLCLTTLPSAPTPHVSQAVGLDTAADVKTGAAQAAASTPAAIANGKVAHKITDAEVRKFNPRKFIGQYMDSEARITALKELIARGLDLNTKAHNDRQGLSLLHLTARINDLPTTQFLIAAGANIDLPDADRITPAHHAAGMESSHALLALTEAGADLEIQKEGVFGATVFDLLFPYQLHKTPIITALIEITTADIDPDTLAKAQQASHKQYIDLGLEYRAQYPTRLAQQLALIQEAIPLPPLAQLIHKLVGRQIFSLEHVKALTAQAKGSQGSK